MQGASSIAIAGDVMLGRGVDAAIRERGYAWPWGDVLPLLRRADCVLVNLECALTRHTTPARDGGEKVFHFRAAPDAIETLRMGRVKFASLANNHSGDFGTAGMLETIAVLDRAGIAHAGAGASLAEAGRPAALAVQGMRVAVVSFADYPPEWAAGPALPGIHYLPVSTEPASFERVERALAAARRNADLVIVSMHWGPNMNERPLPGFREFAHRVVSAGADLFWGHSAHVVQGVEIVAERPILYDTGDFVDDYAVDEPLRNDLSALFLVEVRERRIASLEVAPVRIQECRVDRARGGDREQFVRRFVRLCAEFGTTVTAPPDDANLVVPLLRGEGVPDGPRAR